MAPLLLGAPAQSRAALARFAGELGVLFQIVDDILDVTGSEQDIGKPRGSDARLGKRTYVSVFGLERARRACACFSRSRSRAHSNKRVARCRATHRTSSSMTDFMLSRRS